MFMGCPEACQHAEDSFLRLQNCRTHKNCGPRIVLSIASPGSMFSLYFVCHMCLITLANVWLHILHSSGVTRSLECDKFQQGYIQLLSPRCLKSMQGMTRDTGHSGLRIGSLLSGTRHSSAPEPHFEVQHLPAAKKCPPHWSMDQQSAWKISFHSQFIIYHFYFSV